MTNVKAIARAIQNDIRHMLFLSRFVLMSKLEINQQQASIPGCDDMIRDQVPACPALWLHAQARNTRVGIRFSRLYRASRLCARTPPTRQRRGVPIPSETFQGIVPSPFSCMAWQSALPGARLYSVTFRNSGTNAAGKLFTPGPHASKGLG